jgi:carboxymethylenebutenolidase
MNDHEGAGDKMPAVMALMAKFTPTLGYVEEATLDARRRIIAFFDAHLKY